MLYIDPVACIDCGACLEECPVDAIYADEDLPPELERFRDINEAYFERHPLNPACRRPRRITTPVASGPLRVAIVGAGPAACYAASELLRVAVSRSTCSSGCPLRSGWSAPAWRPIIRTPNRSSICSTPPLSTAGLRCHLNVEVGTRHLPRRPDGASSRGDLRGRARQRSRDLGIPGEDLPGSHAAADFVAWYNGHPDHAARHFRSVGERAVIVGNGNVALDVARMLLSRTRLARTDIADHALAALADSKIREVVILADAGPREAAFSVGEFLALGQLPGIDVIIDSDDLDSNPTEAVETALKLDIARGFAQRQPSPDNKRIVFRFMVSPAEIVGDGDVEGLRLVHNSFGPSGSLVSGDPDRDAELIETSLILRSIGHTGMAIEGVPFEPPPVPCPTKAAECSTGRVSPSLGSMSPAGSSAGPAG